MTANGRRTILTPDSEPTEGIEDRISLDVIVQARNQMPTSLNPSPFLTLTPDSALLARLEATADNRKGKSCFLTQKNSASTGDPRKGVNGEP